VVPVNPVRRCAGRPRHIVTCGQTPVLDLAEARALLDSIDTSGLRDRRRAGVFHFCATVLGALFCFS
jgi:hypothetical protein